MIETVTPASFGNQSTTITMSKAEEQKSQFLQLLVAQMKMQDPLNPMNGTDFVAQLAQFTSVEELINIRQAMENVEQALGQAGTTADPDSTGSGAAEFFA